MWCWVVDYGACVPVCVDFVILPLNCALYEVEEVLFVCYSTGLLRYDLHTIHINFKATDASAWAHCLFFLIFLVILHPS